MDDSRQPVLLQFVFGAILFGAYALVEELLWSRVGGGTHVLIAARTACAALIGGLGLGFVGAASRWLRGWSSGARAGGVLVVGSLAIALVSATRVGDTNSILAMVSIIGLTVLIARRVSLSHAELGQAVALIGPYIVTGVIAAFIAAFIEYAPDRAHRAEGLVRLLLLVWTAATAGAVFYALLGAHRRHRALVFILPVVGLAAISWMPTWFFGLLVALKLCGLVYVALVIGLLANSAEIAPRTVRRLATSIAIAGMLGTFALRASSVSDRFGPLDMYSLMGMVLVLTCEDADDDTFFGGDGGTDPDDADPNARPTDRLLAAPPMPEERNARGTGPSGDSIGLGRPTDVRAEHAIVIIADAMRADSTYGLEGAFLNSDDEFVRFTRAYAPSNTTNVSVPAILDSSAPGPPGSPRDPLFAAVADANPHFAVLTDLEQVWSADRFSVGKDQFSHSSDADAERSYAALALRWLKKRHHANAARTLSVVYLSDPHAPYICDGGGEGGYDCYLDELRRIDRLARELCEHLQREGLLDQTLLIITADHGEEFGEHGFDNHSTNLFEVQIRVPLYLRAPGVNGRQVDQPVSNAGTAATVREVFGAPPPAHGYPSLIALAIGAVNTYPVPVAHHWEDERHDIRVAIRKSAYIEEKQKLIVDWRTGNIVIVDPTDADAPHERQLDEASTIRERHLGDDWPTRP